MVKVENMAKKNAESFEKSLQRLEEIVRSLEEGTLSLDDALRLFEEGKVLVDKCLRKLDEAENKLKILTGNGDVS